MTAPVSFVLTTHVAHLPSWRARAAIPFITRHECSIEGRIVSITFRGANRGHIPRGAENTDKQCWMSDFKYLEMPLIQNTRSTDTEVSFVSWVGSANGL